MSEASDLIALPLTFYLKREGEQWAALAAEISVSSCGETWEKARQGLEDAVETYVLFMVEEGRAKDIPCLASKEFLRDFLADPPGEHEIEEWVLSNRPTRQS